MEIVEQYTLLIDMGGIRRHRARRDPANIGVVGTGRGVENHLALVIEDRQDDGHIGQMRAAIVGIIEREHITGLHGRGPQTDDRAH